MKKKRLLIFCPGYPSYDRPTNGIFTQRSVKALAEKYEVEVIHLQAFLFGRKRVFVEIIDGIPVRRVSIIQFPNLGINKIILFNTFLYSLFIPRLFSKQYYKSFDYFHSTMLFPTSLVIARLAKKLGKPHIAQGIGIDVNINLTELVKYKWVKSRFSLIDCFQFNSSDLEAKFNKEFPERADSFVLHRGVDLDYFSLKREQEISKESVRFVFLGGVQDTKNVFSEKNYKGIHILLKAWSLIERDLGNAYLTIGGPGSTKEIFKDWLNNISCPEKISILESIHPNNVPQLLKRNEVILIPSLVEGLPNLANEAQATGTVVVASNVGGIPETVIDGFSGFLFPAGDFESLAKNLLKIVQIHHQIFLIGQNGRRHMENHFSWKNYVDKIDLKFNQLK